MLLRRMIRAAWFDASLYDEVKGNTDATGEALLVALLMVLGTVLGTIRPTSFQDLVLTVVIAVGLWMLWAWLAYLLGTTIFRTKATQANWGQVFRAAGFAQAPGALRILLFLPFLIAPALALVVFWLISIWQVAAMVFAVRQVLSYESTARALAVVVVGLLPFFVAWLLFIPGSLQG